MLRAVALRAPAALAGLAVLLHASVSSGINILFDYTYATTPFSDGSSLTDPGVQARLAEAAAQFTPFTDDLSRIDESEWSPGNTWSARINDPNTGLPTSIPSLVVPEDTLVIYVGVRELGGTTAGSAGPGGWSISYNDPNWLDTVDFRGQTGEPSDTDFGPWGGHIAFDVNTILITAPPHGAAASPAPARWTSSPWRSTSSATSWASGRRGRSRPW